MKRARRLLHSVTGAWLLSLLWWQCPSAHAERAVAVPLLVDPPFLRAQVIEVLALDEQGRGSLVGDSCNVLHLSEPQVQTATPDLQVAITLEAHTGLELFGQCRGPAPWQGQLHMALTPALDESGRVVLFSASGAELRAQDGSESLLTRPSRALAEALVLPRMEAIRVDVNEPLLAIDAVIEQFFAHVVSSGEPLSERGRLESVAVEEGGLSVLLAFALHEPSAGTAVAASEPQTEAALSEAELAQWRRIEDELDGFLSTVITRLAAQTNDRDLQLDLLGTLLDARLAIAEALASPAAAQADADPDPAAAADEDPVRALFLNAWAQLEPLLGALAALDIADEQSLRLASFIAAGDALTVIDALGPEYGIDVSRDGLRRLARMLLAGDVPASFTPLPLATDPQLRALFGFEADQAGAGQSTVPAAPPAAARWRQWLPIAAAYAQADEDPALLLRKLQPELNNLDNYLDVVARVLAQGLAAHQADPRLSGDYAELFEPLVRATAWKETCWRHYVRRADGPAVIRSAVGAVGMMQIVGRVWRSVYDIERLESDVSYNVAAGIEILEHYLLDYAVRRGEHKQPGGLENLPRATYAAYNGGPSKLSRYRREDVPARAKAVDREFYNHYRAMREAPWPQQSACYAP